jgi:hypothetical protein
MSKLVYLEQIATGYYTQSHMKNRELRYPELIEIYFLPRENLTLLMNIKFQNTKVLKTQIFPILTFFGLWPVTCPCYSKQLVDGERWYSYS